MSGSSLDGLDIAYVHLQERVQKGGWEFQLIYTECVPYPEEWRVRLAGAAALSAREYVVLHAEYGRWIGQEVVRFIAAHGLEYQVQLISSHGHTVFHAPASRMTAQLGDGAAIAAETGINVVSDLRAMDVALGGQGAPIVPVGEWAFWGVYPLLLNLGGIANITRQGAGAAGSGSGVRSGNAGTAGLGSAGGGTPRVAFDVAPANRVMNALAGEVGMAYDREGLLAAAGRVDEGLLGRLNALPYYGKGYPKSLANEFGTEEVLPLVRAAGLKVEDALRTYVEHLVEQIGLAVEKLGFGGPAAGGAGLEVDGSSEGEAAESGESEAAESREGGTAGSSEGEAAAWKEGEAAGVAQGAGGADAGEGAEVNQGVGLGRGAASTRMLATGGGAHNSFLIGRLRERLAKMGVEVVVPEEAIVDFKEAVVMALLGVLRWREENTVLASVTGASRDSIGGAVWIGQEV